MGIMSVKKGLMKSAGTAVAVGKALLFIPLAKIDEVEQTVTGIVTAEVLDKSGEIFHYESSVPYFKAWSANFERVSKGKSKGNIRAMHQPNAVGKVIDLQFDDGNKLITATAKIVDPTEWQKVIEGVYTGFSIGGNYMKQWKDDVTQKSYFTADPIEISIVDNPCVPVAHFTATKADGTTEERPFKLYVPTNEEVVAKATELAGSTGNWTDFISAAKTELITKHGIPDFAKMKDEEDKPEKAAEEEEEAAEADDKKKAKKKDGEESDTDEAAEEGAEEDKEDNETAAKSAIKQVWLATDGTTFEKKAECVAHELDLADPVKKALAAANAKVDAVEKSTKPYGEVAYAIEKDGVSLFPLDSELHIRSSWVFANKSTKLTDAEKATALEAIKKAWAEKIGDEPPTADELSVFNLEQPRAAYEAVKALGATDLNKGFWTVGMWCRIIDDVLCATDCTGWYHEDSDVPQVAKDICAALLTFMVKLVEAEVGHTLSRLDKAARPAELQGLAKFLAGAADSIVPVEPADTVEKAVVTKLEGEIDELKAVNKTQGEQLNKAVEGITALTERFTKYMNQPEPRPALGKVVTKEADRIGMDSLPIGDQAAIKELAEKHTPEELAKMMIKVSQTQPIQVTTSKRLA